MKSEYVKIDKFLTNLVDFLEQATGVEPATTAWEAIVLPLNYACITVLIVPHIGYKCNT